MRPILSSFLVGASLNSFFIALSGHANASGGESDGNYPVVKYIDGQSVVHSKCEWHNFFQSMNMWPRYRICPGKSAYESYSEYLSISSASSSMDFFLALSRGQPKTRADYVTPVGNVEVSFKIGNVSHRASVCAWYNLFQSRYRTPLYIKCEHRTHDKSFGRFSEPDYWKLRKALKGPQKAPDILGFLSGPGGAAELTLPIGGVKHNLSVCQWHNFYHSFNPTPRFVTCAGKSADESYGAYRHGVNIDALKVIGSGANGASLKGFEDNVSVTLGASSVNMKRCALYNWLQSNIRWPIYRTCGQDTREKIISGDKTIFPARDKIPSYDHNYID
jgi:hypothetical protein